MPRPLWSFKSLICVDVCLSFDRKALCTICEVVAHSNVSG